MIVQVRGDEWSSGDPALAWLHAEGMMRMESEAYEMFLTSRTHIYDDLSSVPQEKEVVPKRGVWWDPQHGLSVEQEAKVKAVSVAMC